MVAQTNHQLIKVQRKLNWHSDLFMNGENLHGKNPHRVILRSPLLRIHYYQNKQLQVKEFQYFIPTYNWTLTPISNWTCSVVTISPFNARLLVRDLITNLRRMLGAKFFNSSHDEDQETHWSQNPTVYKHSSFFKRKMNYGKFCLRSQFAWTKLFFTLARPRWPLK